NNHSSDSQEENRVKLKKVPSKRHQTKKIICEICGKGFANNSRLENHKVCHKDGKPHECSQCGKTFKWTFAYSRHMKIHFDTGAKTFKCQICGKSYRFERYLKIHEKNVHGKKEKYPCKWCNQEFFSQAELQVHWKNHSQGVFFSNTNTNISKIVSDLQCTECGRFFSSRDSLKKHMVIHTGRFPFTCDICGKGFTWKEGVRRHLFKHLGISDDLSPMCQICGKKVSRETTLKDHLKIHLRTEHAFKCHFQGCGKTFTSEKFLNRHINDRHSSRRYKCDNCETVYKDKSQLQIHIRRIHLKENAPWNCNMCQRSFWIKRDFRIHMKKHHNLEIS
uniref:C2H2-type domain-containing protein n=1 Tax=Phlebotomus papatasi TaxID=29031 RepID=A0A1B0DF01_PHLPP